MGSYSAKATFTVTKDKGGKRVFHAVNKRAKTVCRKAGKRTTLTTAELKKLVGKGSYRFFAYKDNNTDWDKGAKLVPIRF